jgi:hypothetical protein
MKKLFLILVAIGLTLYLAPLAVVQAADPKDSICTGLKGAALGLCTAYCLAADNDCVANPDSAICEDLRKNNEKINGSRYFPCDQLIACGICADVSGAGTVGECIEVLPFECVEPAMNLGPYSCDEVILPVNSNAYNSCQISEENNPFNVHPLCQNSIPAFVCTRFLKGVVLPPNSCPSLPSCNPTP